MSDNPLKIKLFNVGHGDCILITFPNGELGLIDSKIISKNSKIYPLKESCPALNEIKAKKNLKFICLTHPHLDHFQGMLEILMDSDIKIEKFYHSMDVGLDKALQFHNESSLVREDKVSFVHKWALLQERKRQGELIKIFDFIYESKPKFHDSLRENITIESIGGVNICVLAPCNEDKNEYNKKIVTYFKKENSNETASSYDIKEIRDYANHLSIVFWFKYGNKNILLGGDALSSNWAKILRPSEFNKNCFPVDVLKASHHGSRNSFISGMWAYLLKEKSIIIVSCGKKYHPSKEFVRDFTKKKFNILCTNRGNYCFNGGIDCLESESKHSIEGTSEDDNRACCDWIELEIYPDEITEVKFETGKSHHNRPCKYS